MFQVLTPRKYNDVYLYDTPPTLSRGCAGSCSPVAHSIPEGECYDVPPSHAGVARAAAIHHNSSAPACLNYDTPRSLPRSPLPPQHQLLILQQTRQFNESQVKQNYFLVILYLVTIYFRDTNTAPSSLINTMRETVVITHKQTLVSSCAK